MIELRNDENLTTADIANPPKAAVIETSNLEPANGQQGGVNPSLTSAEPQATNGQLNNGQLNNGQLNNGQMINGQTNNGSSHGPLFPDDELQTFRSRWDQVQTSFVDEPRQAVEQADSLVANVVKRIAEQFATERADLEKQWDRGESVNTEDLRQALKRYRAFFDRLLTF